jgi:hypothetical protein
MLTPAQFEDIMEEYRDRKSNTDRFAEKSDIQRKALKDVEYILKQFGYDSGSEIFMEVMK